MLFEALEMAGMLVPMREPTLADPQDFSIWAMTLENKAAAYRNWMANEHNITQFEAHQYYGYPDKAPRLVQLHEGYGWQDIPRLFEQLPDFIDKSTVKVATSGVNLRFKPGREPYCEQHQLHHRGHTCPVCADNFVNRGRRAIFQQRKS